MKSEEKQESAKRAGGKVAVVVVAVILFMALLSVGMVLRPVRGVSVDKVATVRLKAAE